MKPLAIRVCQGSLLPGDSYNWKYAEKVQVKYRKINAKLEFSRALCKQKALSGNIWNIQDFTQLSIGVL